MDPWYISVDIETAGPYPGAFSVLSIGAVAVADTGTIFYAELELEVPGVDPAAFAYSGLSMERLAAEGEDPRSAFERFAAWVEATTPDGSRAVFVGFNAPFDWMFVADGLHRHTGRNPFGHSALDIKALEMGAAGVGWDETSFAAVAGRHGVDAPLPHHALEDARLQAEVFRRILAALDEGRPAP
ncbi:MAG: 3'-5' exoribonuclease [Actinomycetota bacterium]